MNRAQRRAPATRTMAHQGHLSVTDPCAGLRLLGMAAPLPNGAVVDTALRVRSAYEALRDGSGDDDDFHTLAGALNISLIRAEDIDELAADIVIDAQVALMACLARKQRGLRYGFDAAGLATIPHALDLYEQILSNSTALQMQAALNEAARRMANGLTLSTTNPANERNQS